MFVTHQTQSAAAMPRFAPARGARTLPWDEALTAVIHGLGGQGVVCLTRLLAQALQLRFARTASTETRGIAQRRAPVRAVVRAGAEIRSAAAPESMVNLVIALEASEALRAAPLMQGGRCCLLSDLSYAPSVGDKPVLTPDEIGSRLQALGLRVIPLQAREWMASHRAADATVSTIAYGALIALLELPTERCRSLLLASVASRLRDSTEEAFHWGVLQMSQPAPDTARPCVTAVARPLRPVAAWA